MDRLLHSKYQYLRIILHLTSKLSNNNSISGEWSNEKYLVLTSKKNLLLTYQTFNTGLLQTTESIDYLLLAMLQFNKLLVRDLLGDIVCYIWSNYLYIVCRITVQNDYRSNYLKHNIVDICSMEKIYDFAQITRNIIKQVCCAVNVNIFAYK